MRRAASPRAASPPPPFPRSRADPRARGARVDATRLSLAEQRATGTLMMVAHDKVASMGPPLCLSAFGNASFKLVLDARIPYTLRNAAEQFFAARAPAGFYGVTSSTFSKGVAAMRAARRSVRAGGCVHRQGRNGRA